MVEYVFLIALPCLFFAVKKSVGDLYKLTRNTLLIFFVLFALLLCLRDSSVGIDLSVYLTDLKYTARQPWSHVLELDTEWGWFIFQKIFLSITKSERAFIVICALISVVPICIVYCKECEHPLIAVSLFLTVAPFTMFFSGIRQSIAMGLGVLAFFCLKHKKFILFILISALAFTFHQSAFILIFMLPFYFIKIKWKYAIFVLLAFAVVFAFRQRIFDAILSILPEKYQKSGENTTETGAFGMIILLGMFAVYSFILPKEKYMNREDYGLRTLLVFALFMQAFASVHALAMRFNYYYLLLVPIFMSRIVNRVRKSDQGIAVLSVIVIVMFMITYFFVTLVYGENILKIYPYIWGV